MTHLSKTSTGVLLCLMTGAVISFSTSFVFAQGTSDSVTAKLDWVPQQLLGLLHAPEVYAELAQLPQQDF